MSDDMPLSMLGEAAIVCTPLRRDPYDFAFVTDRVSAAMTAEITPGNIAMIFSPTQSSRKR